MNHRTPLFVTLLLGITLVTGCGVSDPNLTTADPSFLHSASITDAASAATCNSCHDNSPHYGGVVGGQAQFVANNALCGDCHANGDPSVNGTILNQYASSAHGDIRGPAWVTSSSHDWPNATTTTTGGDCKGCHSTSGFIARLGGTTPAPVTAGVSQTLACKSCHTNLATGALRYARNVVAYYKSQTYNKNSSSWNPADYALFPDVGIQNNLCINCHSGRESGESILALTDSETASMTDTGFKNPHYFAAAGMMYAKLAFIDFDSRDKAILVSSTPSTYGKSLTANEDGGDLTSTHRKLGTTGINGDRHKPSFFIPGNLDGGGPCITCHMANNANHTLIIGPENFNNVCSNCHSSEAGVTLTAVNFKELFIEEQAVPFQNAVALALATLEENFGIVYDDKNYPYFFPVSATTHSSTTAVRNWTNASSADGVSAPGLPALASSPLSVSDAKKLMGACLNIKLMKADPAAYIHARTYSRRVLYDTIDWLDDMTINQTTGTTAIAWDPVIYGKGADANSPETTINTKYLTKSSSGAWDTNQERP